MRKKPPPTTTTIPPPPRAPVRPGHKKSETRTSGRDKGPSKPRADGKAARPTFQPSAEQRNVVIVMVAGGIQQNEIAASIGITKKTLAKYFKAELKHGLSRANAHVVGNLFRQTKENVRAAEFWLTNRDSGHWAHKQKIDQSIDMNLSLEDLVLMSMGKKAVPKE